MSGLDRDGEVEWTPTPTSLGHGVEMHRPSTFDFDMKRAGSRRRGGDRTISVVRRSGTAKSQRFGKDD